MNILTLIIKDVHYRDIMSGKKKLETREIRPNTAAKYCEFDKDGNFVRPKKYDAIKFFVGYQKNRAEGLVKVLNAEVIVLTDEETGEDIVYAHEGKEYVACIVEYSLGEIISAA